MRQQITHSLFHTSFMEEILHFKTILCALRNKSLCKLGMLLPNFGFDFLHGWTDFDLYPGYCDGGVLLSQITEKKMKECKLTFADNSSVLISRFVSVISDFEELRRFY